MGYVCFLAAEIACWDTHFYSTLGSVDFVELCSLIRTAASFSELRGTTGLETTTLNLIF